MNFTDLGGSIKWMKSVKPRKRLTAVKVLAIMRLRKDALFVTFEQGLRTETK